MKTSYGFMYIAKRPCGKLVAAAWEVEGFSDDKDKQKTLVEWIEAGYIVERVERFEGDPNPEWLCFPGCKNCLDESYEKEQN